MVYFPANCTVDFYVFMYFGEYIIDDDDDDDDDEIFPGLAKDPDHSK